MINCVTDKKKRSRMRNNTKRGRIGQEKELTRSEWKYWQFKFFLFVFEPDQQKLQFYMRINTASVTDRLVFCYLTDGTPTSFSQSQNIQHIP